MARRESDDDEETSPSSTRNCEKQTRRRQRVRELVFDGIARGREGSEPFPKAATYCHLLLLCNRKAATLATPVAFVALDGHVGQPVIDH